MSAGNQCQIVQDLEGNKFWTYGFSQFKVRWMQNQELPNLFPFCFYLHREDGPAVELADGSKFYYLKNVLHREDGPAIEYANGTNEWHLNGSLHRVDGPAIERADGNKEWYQNGRLHREDGPAMVRADGSKEWFLNGRQVNERIVLSPSTFTVDEILKVRNAEVRSIMIERYGWLRYLQDTESTILDSRHNDIENTKEVLFAVKKNGHRLVVTCPTGRVFILGIPTRFKTCEAAQRWLGNDVKSKINVIGRT